MKKLAISVLLLIFLSGVFGACSSGSAKTESPSGSTGTASTAAPAAALHSFEDVKTAFETAFGGKGCGHLKGCYIENAYQIYTALGEIYGEFEEPVIYDSSILTSGVDIDEYFSSKDFKALKSINWDGASGGITGSDLLGRYYSSASENGAELLESLNSALENSMGANAPVLTDFIHLRAYASEEDRMLSAYAVETADGFFLIAFEGYDDAQ